MADPGSGVLIAEGGGWSFGWTAVRIDAAADLSETQEYQELSESGRLEKAVFADRSWAAGLWDTTHRERFDLRYLSDPATGRISCTVLGRVTAQGTDAAVAAGTALRRRMLLNLPRHVHASEVADTAQVHRALLPFQPAPTGVAEVRKRILTGRPNRPDAGVDHYMMVQPFTTSAASWEPLWRALATQDAPVLLSIGLTPIEIGPQTTNSLQTLATLYHRLGTPGELPGELFTEAVRLSADAFAVDAERIFADAARRYAGRIFQLRITLASPAHLPDSLCELVGRTVSPNAAGAGSGGPGSGSQGGALTEVFSGAAHTTVRPRSPQEQDAAWRNVTAMEQFRWDAQYYAGLPQQPPELLRRLSELADPAEVGAALRLPCAVAGHLPGFPVRRPEAAGIVDYQQEDGHLSLGSQLVGGRPAGPLGIAVGDLTRHALFVGTTGSGKTNSTLAFCEQLWRDHHVPFLVIEPVNAELDDYRWLATRPGFEDMLVLTVGDEQVAPLRLNPFEAPHGVPIRAHMSGLKACFDAAFGLWDPLPAIYDKALESVYRNRGIVPTERSSARYDGRWPRLDEFSEQLALHVAALGYQGEVRSNIEAAAQLRAQSLAHGACASTLDCARSFPIEALMHRPVVVELAAVGDNQKEQTLITALLLSVMTEYYKAVRVPSSRTEHAIIIEEAHRLLGKPAGARGGDAKEGDAQALAASRFANTLAENRKYGEALVIVEQVPAKLVDDAYKNSNLKVMHRLPAEDDRRTIGSSMRFSPDQERQASALAPFTAFAHHDRLDRPALIQVPDVRGLAAVADGLDRAPLATSAQLRHRFELFTAATPAADLALAPFEECAGCRHRCMFRSHAEPAATKSAAAELNTRVTAFRTVEKAQKPAWWSETLHWLRDAAELTAPYEASEAGLADYHACVMVHLGRSLNWKHTAKWAAEVRTRIAAGEGATAPNDAVGGADPDPDPGAPDE